MSRKYSLILLCLSVLLSFSFADAALAKKKKKKTKSEVTGVVTDMDGKVQRGVAVTVKNEAGEVVGEAKTNKKGEFEIELPGAPAGKYSVTFVGEGFANFTGEVEMQEGETQDLNVKLLSAEQGEQNEAIQAYNAAAEAHRARNLDEALTQFLKAVEINPELSQSYLGIADIYLQQGKTAEAVEAAEKFIAANPDDEQGKKVAFEAYRRAGMMDKAKEVAGDKDSEALTKDLAVGVYNEGAVASQQGDYDTALAKFLQAAELNPELGQAHSGAASILYNQQKFDEAYAAAERALALEPGDRQGIRIKYLSLDAKGQIDEALKVWDAYKEIDPDGAVDLLYRRADLDFQGGDNPRAQEALLKVLELKPDFARGHYTLGLVYSGTDPAKAKEHLLKFIELAPDDPEVPAAKEILAYF